jgi:RNA polymerase sigma-70 factor (ECF subfamily)
MPEWDDESSLLRAIARGDGAAADALVDRTHAKVFGLLVQLTADRDLAADLTQETYRRAWAALASFDGRAQLSSWLYRIAYNVFLNHVRRPARFEPLDDERAAAVADSRPGAEDVVAASEIHGRVRRAVLALPEELRCVVVARYWADAPVAEIAALEGITEMAIRKRLRRALDRLGVALARELS